MKNGSGGSSGQGGRGGREGRRTTRWTVAFMLFSALSALSALPALGQETKTIKPGMTDAEVRATWGEPITARKAGNMMYLYYTNDCLRSCGTYDVVFLENGQVVDAVVRDSHRGYDGVASSARERKPEATVKP